MRLRPLTIVVAAAAGLSCDDGDRLVIVDPVPRDAVLTVVATPVSGTTATAVDTITCRVWLEVNPSSGSTINGSFVRNACTGLVNPTADAYGGFSGTREGNGAARLQFFPALLPSSAAVTTSGGCPADDRAAGPFEGRMTDSALDLRSSFRLGCAGPPSPAPPAFDVEYRIARR
jgi:hypothetical protein